MYHQFYFQQFYVLPTQCIYVYKECKEWVKVKHNYIIIIM